MTTTFTEKNTMNIAKFKKILPILRLIGTPVGKVPAERTIDIRHSNDDREDDKDYLVITARDAATKVEVKAVGVNTESFFGTVNFSKFNKVLTSIKSMPRFYWSPDGLEMYFGKRHITLANWKSARVDYEDLKFDPIGGCHQWTPSKLLEGLEYTSVAMSDDETRFHLCGTLLTVDGQLVTTDGHRLHKYDYQYPEGGEVPGFFKDFKNTIIPRSAIRMILAAIKSCGTGVSVHSYRSNHKMSFIIGGGGLEFTITTNLIQSNFPPYEAVIPKSWNTKFTVDAMSFSQASKLLSKLSDTGAKTVKFAVSDSFHLKGEGVSETIKISDVEGPEFDFGTMGASSVYIAQAADLPSPEVTIEFGEYLAPFVFKQGAFLAVVMPHRV